MNRLLLMLILLFVSLGVAGQDNPAKWSVKQIDNQKIIVTATINEGFHIYDMKHYEDGPMSTSITIKGDGVKLIGELKPSVQPTVKYDKTFSTDIGFWSGKVTFTQNIKVTKPSAKASIEVMWMACDATSCIAPEEEIFTLELKGEESVAEAELVPDAAQSEHVAADSTEVAQDDEPILISAQNKSDESLLGLIIEAILWGFAALLTPCVFPMIPMTVSLFIKSNSSPLRGRINAILYGLFIIALYTVPIAVIIVVTRFAGGESITADIFNFLATHWLPNVIFFLVFMLFAASFFGAFEITMPSWMVNKSDSQVDKGGLGGIFFMALTLVLVSFSCTGPIVGSVLIKSTQGEFLHPIITMLAFSTAFALPFTIFALFPSLLKNLPKSGGWLNSVKVVLGFLEVALGLKFLSVADQTYHWGLLDREIYLAIWIVVFTLLGLYLLGKLRFKHDSKLEYVGVGRLALAIVTFSFVVYMIPGMLGAPLKALSGYLPPISTQDFVLGNEQKEGSMEGRPKYSDFLRLPHNLQGFFDFDEALAYAKKVDKPLFVDFTGHGCVNCREMEARVWSNKRVLDLLRSEFVIVALYSDDKKVLPQSDWVVTPSGRELKTLGRINSYFASTRFGVNAQPYYMILDNNGDHLVQPRGYDLNVDNFVRFLESGVAAYK